MFVVLNVRLVSMCMNVVLFVVMLLIYKTYNIVSPSLSMNCGTENILYLITCRKCGIQYVEETGQSLRKRLNNHRNRLKK